MFTTMAATTRWKNLHTELLSTQQKHPQMTANGP